MLLLINYASKLKIKIENEYNIKYIDDIMKDFHDIFELKPINQNVQKILGCNYK
jgi:hypothetical protein